MRQTFADEIVNAGYGLHPETVVISMASEYLPEREMASEFTICQPIFDYCFVQMTIDNKAVSGAWFGRLDSPDFVYWIQFFTKSSSHPGTIGYIPTPLHVTFDEGMIVSLKDSPLDFAPPSQSFAGVMFKDGVDGRKAAFGAVMYAFYLMHQKTEVELVTPSRQVSRQIERKTGKKPSPYFEIKVDPTKPQKRYTSHNKVGQKRDAHIVRGNFATYTDEAPLFGKYTGTFFRPSHARGITGDTPKPKNYRIVLPEEIQQTSDILRIKQKSRDNVVTLERGW